MLFSKVRRQHLSQIDLLLINSASTLHEMMMRSTNYLLLVGGVIAILSTGCAFSGKQPVPPPGAIGHQNPVSQPAGQVATSNLLSAPAGHFSNSGYRPGISYPTLQSMSGPQATAPAVAPVSFNHPAVQQSNAALAAHQLRGCNCKQFGSCQNCGPVPFGYRLPTAGPTNAFGIDPSEFICDGGDNPRTAVRRDDTLVGLQPEDTVVHYTPPRAMSRYRPVTRSVCTRLVFSRCEKSQEFMLEGVQLRLHSLTSRKGPVDSISPCLV